MSRGFGLADTAQQQLPRSTRRQLVGGFPETPSFVGEPMLKGFIVNDARALFHALLPFLEEGGSATGVLITDKCHEPCGDTCNMRFAI